MNYQDMPALDAVPENQGKGQSIHQGVTDVRILANQSLMTHPMH